MPTAEWNKSTWDGSYDWKNKGDEWSEEWGTAEAQWFWSIYPRIHPYLHAQSILEIAPGYGRWTQYLLPHCKQLYLVDYSAECIDACKSRFKHAGNISYHVNDGLSLSMIKANSIDFAFSFDSLVHVEFDVISSYLEGFSEKLSENGVAVIHHSNLGSFKYFHFMRKVEAFLSPTGSMTDDMIENRDVGEEEGKSPISRRLLDVLVGLSTSLRLLDRSHMRAISVTAEKVAEKAASLGLECVSQETISWGQSRRAIDCISIIARKGSTMRKLPIPFENLDFTKEAKYIRKTSGIYTTSD